MMATITWLLTETFTIVILFMDFALNVEYSDVVLCGAFAAIKNYAMDGLGTIRNSMSLLRNHNYKKTHQIMPIWNEFHSNFFVNIDMATPWLAYILLIKKLNFFAV